MSDLDELKNLLFGAEKRALDSIAERVERRDVRSADIADVLPEAVHRSHKNSTDLVESLTSPVGEVLKSAFRDDPETYGNALYPVMGPAIRKSIMHALRGFAQQINEAVEQSVSPKGLKWRWQASRAGIPFGEFVLQKTLLYRVEQAYLISRENGLLVSHVHHEASKIKDSDAVSAMFTAIQDFVKESFSPDRTGRLESADMGEFTLWAVHGPHALLVCVIRGVPPRQLRSDLSAILERIHFRYGEAIRDYKGDTSSVPDVEEELERCLRFQAKQQEEDKKRGVPLPLLVILLILTGAIVYFGVTNWLASQRQEQLQAALDATPGLYISRVSRNGSRLSVEGLRDPLAPTVADVAAGVDIEADDLDVAMQPFYSLAPDIVLRRASRALDTPDGVTLELSGTTLTASGAASSAWRQRAADGARSIAGIDAIDLSNVTSTDPVIDPRAELDATLASLTGRRFFFERGATLAADSAATLDGYVIALRALADSANAAGYELTIIVAAATDASGSEAVNAVIARDRGLAVANVLTAAGLTVGDIGRTAVDASSQGVDPRRRYAQVDLTLTERP